MSPWEVLGLERTAASDPEGVKRAYARLLRQHRPDRDPEGFRRIRDAYECLTGPYRELVLQDGGRVAGMAARPGMDDVASTAADPPTAEDRWAAVVARCSAGGSDHECAASLRELGLPGEPSLDAADSLALTLSAHAGVLTALCDDDWLIAAAAQGASGPLRLAAHHLEQQDQQRLERLIRRAVGDKAIAADGGLLLELSSVSALHHPGLAQDMLDQAYLSLPPRMRRMVDSIEPRIRFGFEMLQWPASQRQLAVSMLETGQMTGEMDAELRRRIHVLPYDSALRRAFEHSFPDALRIPHAEEFKPVIREAADAPTDGFSITKLMLAAFIVLLAARLATCAAYPQAAQPPPRAIPPRYATPPEPTRPLGLPFAEVAETVRRLHMYGQLPGMTIDDHIAGDVPAFTHGSLNHRLLLVVLAKDRVFPVAQRVSAIEHLGTMGATRELNSLSTDSLGQQALDLAVQDALTTALNVKQRR